MEEYHAMNAMMVFMLIMENVNHVCSHVKLVKPKHVVYHVLKVIYMMAMDHVIQNVVQISD